MIVQWSPAAPVYVEQSFVKWTWPFRLDDADSEASAVFGERVRATKPAASVRPTIVGMSFNFIVVSFPDLLIQNSFFGLEVNPLALHGLSLPSHLFHEQSPLHHKLRTPRGEVVIKVGQKAENADVTYTFGPFRLDIRAGELRRNDERVSLTPKVFQLLLLLVENPGTLITKREFLDKIWGETNVEEGSVTRAITSLRSALSDKASRPEYVQTVPRRGYRFVATVQRAAGDFPSKSSFQVVVGERRYPLKEGENVLGRAADCEVPLELASISRHHAVITVDGNRMTLRDLRSKNGTFIGGRRIDGTVDVSDCRQIRLGSVTLIVISASGDPSTLTETAQRISGESNRGHSRSG